MKNWVCDGLVVFLEAPRMVSYPVLGAVGPRAATTSGLARRLLRWPCLSGMVDLTCEAVDDTA